MIVVVIVDVVTFKLFFVMHAISLSFALLHTANALFICSNYIPSFSISIWDPIPVDNCALLIASDALFACRNES